MIRIIAGLVLVAILYTPCIQAQSPTGPKPSFEVASIKPTDTCLQKFPGGIMFDPPTFQGGFYKGCNSLKKFMEEAYQTDNYRIEGGPSWVDGASYRIEAKTNPATDKNQMHLMLQSLLEERFKLKLRRESREMQVYSLVVAKDGPKLLKAKLDENGNQVDAVPQPSSPEASSEKTKPAGKGKRDWRLSPQLFGYGDGPDGQMEFWATAISVTRFADWLIELTDRKVIDKTGITGLYDINFKWANDRLNQTKNNGTGANPLPEISGPSLFKAFQDQLGLKLELDKVTFEFIVIDSAEKPSEN